VELISCITPTFNRKGLLENAIRSCVEQTYKNWEMIIIDDGSEDGTDEMVREVQKSETRIKYFRNPGKGANAARNYGILKSTGEYLVFLDDDDEHLPHRFESQLNAVKKSGSNFILSGFQVKDLATGRVIKEDFGHSKGMGAGHGVRWMISRELVVKAGLFDEDMPAMQEVELSYRIAEFENYAFHNSVVMVGGVNHTSITKSKEKMIRGRLRLMEKHADGMLPLEAAWWYYVIGMDYLSTGDRAEAGKFFKLAADLDYRNIYRIANLYFSVMRSDKGVIGRINSKVLSLLCGFRYPELVNHKVVS